mgnify:CR=1 FL=1
MAQYPLESDLSAELDRCDELVRLCAAGELSFKDFLAGYANFYWAYALDGHESDPAGLAVIAKLADRIAPHQVVAETVLAKICSDADAAKESYRSAGRIDSMEAVARLKVVASGLPGGEA